jgi:hypothetical protein
LLAAIAVSLGAPRAAAARPHKVKRAPLVGRRVHHLYATHDAPRFAPPAALPYAPEYGFLGHVPPNAIRAPGYTFVPGVKILGESCDRPTSACTNEYRELSKERAK